MAQLRNHMPCKHSKSVLGKTPLTMHAAKTIPLLQVLPIISLRLAHLSPQAEQLSSTLAYRRMVVVDAHRAPHNVPHAKA